MIRILVFLKIRFTDWDFYTFFLAQVFYDFHYYCKIWALHNVNVAVN